MFPVCSPQYLARRGPIAQPADLAGHPLLLLCGLGAPVVERCDIDRVEARAEDGVVEAVSAVVNGAPVLAVQWHPEWEAHLNPVSTRLFEAFGRACCNFRDRHRGPDGIR